MLWDDINRGTTQVAVFLLIKSVNDESQHTISTSAFACCTEFPYFQNALLPSAKGTTFKSLISIYFDLLNPESTPHIN